MMARTTVSSCSDEKEKSPLRRLKLGHAKRAGPYRNADEKEKSPLRRLKLGSKFGFVVFPGAEMKKKNLRSGD